LGAFNGFFSCGGEPRIIIFHFSFDPNIRPEILSVEEIRKLCRPMIERDRLILPRVTEAAILIGEPNDDRGCGSCRKWESWWCRKTGARGASCTAIRGG